jgi:O-antigen/teichoic acid export membrane protein
MADPPRSSTAAAAPPERPLHHSAVFALVGTVVFNLCRFAVVILLAKFADAAVVGAFNGSVAWATPVVAALMLELRAAYVADARGAFTFGTYATLRWLGVAAAAVMLTAIGAWRAAVDPTLAGIAMFAAVALGRLAWGLGELYWGVYQRHERLDLLARAQIVRGLLMALPFAVLLPLAQTLVNRGTWPPDAVAGLAAAAAGVYAVGWLAAALAADRPRAIALGPVDAHWDWISVGRLARRTTPLGLVVLIILSCESLPLLVIDALGPGARAQVGYFGVLATAVLPVQLIVVALGQATAARVARYHRDDAGRLIRLVARLVAIAAGLALATLGVAVVLGPWLLRVVFRPEYAAYARELVIVAAGSGLLLLAIVCGVVLTGVQRFWVQVPLQLAVLATTAVAALALIPADPVSGAAWTYLARSVCQCVLYGIAVTIALWQRRRIGA